MIETKIDGYTRVSTPRSEMLFKKGYLSRQIQFLQSISAMTSTESKSSSSPNDSASGSVISNEEIASFYSIHSLSPTNGTNQGSDTTSATYPNDIYDPDMPLYYSSGFYDNNGYFYVNRMYSTTSFCHSPGLFFNPFAFLSFCCWLYSRMCIVHNSHNLLFCCFCLRNITLQHTFITISTHTTIHRL